MPRQDFLFSELMKNVVPEDSGRQSDSYRVCDAVLAGEKIATVLDLGCGEGFSFDYFKAKKNDILWVGVDLDVSPEVMRRKRTDACFITFDGTRLPFSASAFDLVLSNQVFEHVRKPEQLLAEVNRVLRPGGSFIGSVSHLEPYHSMSLWNFTPYGFIVLLQDSGLKPLEIRPGVDSLTLIARRMLQRFWKRGICSGFESPLNLLITGLAKMTRKSARECNLIKLVFCGQFSFRAVK